MPKNVTMQVVINKSIPWVINPNSLDNKRQLLDFEGFLLFGNNA